MLKIVLLFLIQLSFLFTELKPLLSNDNVFKRKIILDNSIKKYSIGLFLDYLEDKDKELKIEDIND